jgi:glycine cleavage system H protein
MVTLGISDFAQDQLGDCDLRRLARGGRCVEADDEMGGVESAKSVSDLISPVSGEVVEVNPALSRKPRPFERGTLYSGWLAYQSSWRRSARGLMNADEYRAGLDLDK